MTRTADQIAEDYSKYRGRCKELSEAECAKDPTLRLVRGHVFVPGWATVEAHWWCERPDGTVVDPSVLQFPFTPVDYEEFDGILFCCNCGDQGTEDTMIYLGSGDYFACSNSCANHFVGLD